MNQKKGRRINRKNQRRDQAAMPLSPSDADGLLDHIIRVGASANNIIKHYIEELYKLRRS